jgi:hypothetical protein
MPREAPIAGAVGSFECADRARLAAVGAPRGLHGALRTALVDAVMPHLPTHHRAPCRETPCPEALGASAADASSGRCTMHPLQKRPNSSIPPPPESTTGAADQLAPCFDFSRGALGAAAAEPVSISKPSTMANKPPA